MTPRKILAYVDRAFSHYEKGLETLRKDTIKELKKEMEQSITHRMNTQLPSTDKESGKKVCSTG